MIPEGGSRRRVGAAGFAHQKKKKKRKTSGLIKSPHRQSTIKQINVRGVTLGLSMQTMGVGQWAS